MSCLFTNYIPVFFGDHRLPNGSCLYTAMDGEVQLNHCILLLYTFRANLICSLVPRPKVLKNYMYYIQFGVPQTYTNMVFSY